jgi:cellulose synthase operon protein C
LFELGRLSLRRGQLDQAQAWFEKAQAAASPGDHQGTLALVDLHLSQNKLPAATAALRALALRAPDDLQVMLTQARLSLANGDALGARNLLNRATALAGFEAGSLMQIAVMQLQLGQTAGAQYALEKALADNPQLLAAQAMMVDVELRQRAFDRAEARVRQLLAEQPRVSLVHALQGDVALARGQLAPALAAYRRAHQIEPQSAHMLRIHRTLSQTDPAAANSTAERWLAQMPNDHAVRRVLADSQARLGQYAAARASYEVLAKATPGDAEALNNLAHVLVLLKDPQAPAVAEKALAASPGEAHIMGVAGWANIVAGQTERGMNWLRAARLRDPDNADTRYFLAAALAQQGRKADAREELSGVLEPGRHFLHAKEAQALLESLK